MSRNSEHRTIRDRHDSKLEQAAIRGLLEAEQWDVAASFLIPKALMVHLNRTCIRADDISLSRELTHCFNRLDRKVFKSAHRARGLRVPRYVHLERTDEVGWHAHGLLRTPEGVSQLGLCQTLQQIWLKQMRGFSVTFFEPRLFWADVKHGRYDLYSTKYIDGNGSADWLNAVLQTPGKSARQTRQ